MIDAALASQRQIADQHGIADSQLARGDLLLDAGQVDAAQAALAEAAAITLASGDRVPLFEALEAIARAAAARQPQDAIRLAAAVRHGPSARAVGRGPSK